MPDGDLISWPYTNKTNYGGHGSNLTTSASGREPFPPFALHSTPLMLVARHSFSSTYEGGVSTRGLDDVKAQWELCHPTVSGTLDDHATTYKYPNQLGDPIQQSCAEMQDL
ncbi:hypothetical protein M0R45_016454 [Rubus argutus]|uniref:Uncharacterized protein n=1 Tax=Rubus argutus TaxID=59490 RepID=A0AAW1XV30_RUBAR